MKILVIDDDAALRYRMAAILAKEGYQVAIATDGDHGLAIFHNDRPDVVICDLMMPQRNGLDTIAQMRRESPAMRIIAISGAGATMNADGLATALAGGANEVIVKPFNAAELLAAVEKVVA